MIPAYIAHLKSRRLSPETIKLFSIELKTLSRFGRDLEAIQMHLSNCAPATHARKVIMWKQYLRFSKDKFLESLEVPKVSRKNISFLTSDEMDRLDAYALSLPTEERLFIQLGLNMGLRLSEILQVSKRSLDNGWLSIKRKGGNEQRLPVPEFLIADLRDFEGFRMGKKYFQRMMHRVSKALEFKKKVTPHTLRHSFATRAISERHDIATLKECLGHSSIQSTERYLHVTPERLTNLIERNRK